jgi:hypothetical protein
MMKRLSILLFGITLLVPLIGMVGCETESSEQRAVTISPSSVSLANGQSQVFTAEGWQDYSWSLSDTSAGTLSTKKGSTTIYTAVASLSSNSAQVLTVSADNTSSGVTGTVSTVTAEALITHL